MNWLRIFKRYRDLEQKLADAQKRGDDHANIAAQALSTVELWKGWCETHCETFGSVPNLKALARNAQQLERRRAIQQHEKNKQKLGL